MAVLLSHVHFSGRIVQSNSRISIVPECAGSEAEFASMLRRSTVDRTLLWSVAKTSQPRAAKVSLWILPVDENQVFLFEKAHARRESYATSQLHNFWT